MARVASYVIISLLYLLYNEVSCISVTYPPFVDAITYSHARILWQTDVASSTYIKYGTTSGNLDKTFVQRYVNGEFVHQFFLSGLSPSTTYYFQACSDGGGTACSSETSFTTLSAPASPDPIAPEEFDTSPPQQDGENLYVGEDCNDPETGLQALIDKAQWGDTIYIPTNIVCSGSFNYPAKDPDTVEPHRWIVIRSAAEDDRLPPPGVRYNSDLWADSLATIQLSSSNMRPFQGEKETGTPCNEPIGYYWKSTSDIMESFPSFPVRRCGFSNEKKYTVTGATYTADSITLTLSSDHVLLAGQRVYVDGISGINFFGLYNVHSVTANTVTFNKGGLEGSYSGGGFIQMVEWVPLSYTTGTTRPTGSCNEGDWYFNEVTGHVYLCSQSVKGSGTNWSFMTFTNALNAVGIAAALNMRPNAHHLYVMGLRLTVLIPEQLKEYAIGTPSFLSYPLGATFTNIIYSGPSNHHIVLDRCDINGQMQRARVTYGAVFDGEYMAITNSLFHSIGYWQNVSYWGGPASNGIIFFVGRGPGKIYNNVIEVYGLSLFFSDDAGSCVNLPEDYVIDRNYFLRDDKYRYGSDTFLGLGYAQRQLGEHKVGKRTRWSGNRFENNWVEDVLNGAALAFTPRPGSGIWYKKVEGGKIFPLSPPSSSWSVQAGDVVLINPTTDKKLATVISTDADYIYVDSSLNYFPDPFDRLWCMSSESNMLQDILVEGNYFYNSPAGIFTIGHTEKTPMTGPLSRLRIVNNLFHNMNTQRGGVGLKSGGDYLYYTTLGPEDQAFEHNTVVQLNAERKMKPLTFDTDGFLGPTLPGNYFGFKDNIVFFPPDELMIRGTSGVDGKYWGTVSLDTMFTNWDSSKTLVIGKDPQSDYPDTLLWVGNYTSVFTDADRGDFSVKEGSPYKGAATDGTDIGYNKDRYEVLQGYVKDVSASVSESTVTFTFRAPDSQPCHVDIYQYGQFVSRVTNNSNQRDQSVSKDVPNGDYEYYVLCAVYQPSGSFSVNNPNAPSSGSLNPLGSFSAGTSVVLTFNMLGHLLGLAAFAL